MTIYRHVRIHIVYTNQQDLKYNINQMNVLYIGHSFKDQWDQIHGQLHYGISTKFVDEETAFLELG